MPSSVISMNGIQEQIYGQLCLRVVFGELFLRLIYVQFAVISIFDKWECLCTGHVVDVFPMRESTVF
jgi:hypothetical protein